MAQLQGGLENLGNVVQQMAQQQEAMQQQVAQQQEAMQAQLQQTIQQALARAMQAAQVAQQAQAAQAAAQAAQVPQPAPGAPASVISRNMQPTPRFAGGKHAPTWLKQLEHRYRLQNITGDQERIGLAGQAMSGSAVDWFMTVCDTVLTWEEFKQRLLAYYVPQDEPRRARERLLHIKQGGSAERYVTEFRHQMTVGKVPDDAHMMLDMFMDGLKLDLKREVMRTNPQNLDEAIKACGNAENLMARARPGGPTPRGYNDHSSAMDLDAMDLEGMDLDAMDMRRDKGAGRRPGKPHPLSAVPKELVQKRREAMQCLRCGKPDHAWRQCPEIKKGQGNGQARPQGR